MHRSTENIRLIVFILASTSPVRLDQKAPFVHRRQNAAKHNPLVWVVTDLLVRWGIEPILVSAAAAQPRP